MKWDTVCFGNLYEEDSRNGLTKPSKVRGSGYKMINMGELFANDRIYDVPMELVPLKDKEKKNAKIECGDLLFARQSLVLEGAGKCSIVMDVSPLTVFESHIIRVRLKKTVANPLFYYYYFKSPYSEVKTIVSQCAQAGIRGSDLRKLNVIHPSLDVQNRIAVMLSSYDDLIENNYKQIKLLEEVVQRLYKEWFVDFRFPGHETAKFINGLPERWRKEAFINIFSYVRGKSYSSAEIEAETGILMANLKNIKPFGGYNRGKEKHFNGTYKEEQTISSGDVIMAVTDMTQERRLVGYVARVPRLHKKAIFSMDIIKLIPVKISKIFLYSLLNYGNFGKILSQKANGTNVLHLRPENILDVIAIIPEEKIENNFVKNITPLFNKIDTLEDQICLLQEARDRLLPKLMNGEIEV